MDMGSELLGNEAPHGEVFVVFPGQLAAGGIRVWG